MLSNLSSKCGLVTSTGVETSKPNTLFQFEPIGYIETCFKERFGTPRQPGLVPSSWGQIRLRNELNLSDALVGLDGFSHIWVIFVFHQNTNKGIKTKVHPPRLEGEKIGLYATRTPHRPNPIGLSVVKLEKIEGGIVYVSGVDLVDGTPVLDIKPYLPTSDALPEARMGWTSARPERTIEVEMTDAAIEDLKSLVKDPDRFRQAVREILELDPRPNFYKGTAEKPNPYTDVYGFRLDDFNVVYRMQEARAIVLNVTPFSADFSAPRDRA
jgi:tRNA-Thr(GGU) m(6)t(6)A37 methyltransferase TsaA